MYVHLFYSLAFSITYQRRDFTSDNTKKGNVLFNDGLNTFYLRLYDVRHVVKHHSDSERKPAAAT